MDLTDLLPGEEEEKEEEERSCRGDDGKRCKADRHLARDARGGGSCSRPDGARGSGFSADDVDGTGHAARHERPELVKADSSRASACGKRHDHQWHIEEGPDSAAQDVEQPGCVLLLSAGADHAAYYSPMGRKGGLGKVGSLQTQQAVPQATPCDLRRQKTASWLPGSWSSWFSSSSSSNLADSSASVADHCETYSQELQLEEVQEKVVREIEEAQEGGHEFRACGQPTWCDLCGEFMWGVARRSLRCQRCKFSCHQRCQSHVRLECQHGWAQSEELLLQDTSGDSSPGQDPLRPLSPEELQQRIAWYNEQVDNGLSITLHASGRYTGFICVELKLCRPVSIKGSGQQQAAARGQLDDGARGGAGAPAPVRRAGRPAQVRAVRAHPGRRAGSSEEAVRRGKASVSAAPGGARPHDPELPPQGERERRRAVGGVLGAGVEQLSAHPVARGRRARAAGAAALHGVPGAAAAAAGRTLAGVKRLVLRNRLSPFVCLR